MVCLILTLEIDEPYNRALIRASVTQQYLPYQNERFYRVYMGNAYGGGRSTALQS